MTLEFMRHHYTIRKGSYRLRPVRLEDSAFIVGLRIHPERSRFINATSPDVAKQEDWLREYFERVSDYYFVIEHAESGEREGTLGIYNIDREMRTAEWGRWVVRPGSKAALPSGCMAFDLAFSELGLQSLHSYVAAEHTDVLKVLSALGMQSEAFLQGYLRIDGVPHDAVKLQISRSDWEAGQ
ncbi:MAG: acetyltransferase, family [Bryobacterales bacterium]|jgi:RimJ/RimL family protein N-acetyltransferase|nr:acetyltransferase, family [Bryobacterales bacterium]